jgi:tetratricopeptide (TPR) repeat protein
MAIGLAAALVIGILAIVLANAGGGDPPDRQAGSTTPKATKTTPKRTPAAPPAAAQTPTTETPAAATNASTGNESPSALNDRGYALMKSGNNAAAVPLLKRSVDGFRATGTKSNVNYAYALYNLAGALMATGDPAAAIPYLEERIAISSDRRALVQQTLAQAQEQAGVEVTAADGKNAKAKGKKV